MKFRRLRLTGFKSFVEPATLEIEEGLTGVVGPNGCGKSNLLEAMRWTMGESSPKSLRGGGMEDVIFAGTGRRASRDIAEVVLVLDNADRRAPAPFNDSAEIEVSRRIERGLGSLYRINGRDVRQKDVQLLFADAATGAHSPALVSQGRVGAIVNARPQDRRQLLEEAAGISGLHVRRREAEQRLSAAETNLARLSDLLSGLESQAAGLRRQARLAERYSKLSERIRLAEGMLLYARWRRARQQSDAAGEALAALEADLKAAQGEVERIGALQREAKAGLPAARDAERESAMALSALEQEAARLGAVLAEGERRREALSSIVRQARADAVREAAARSDAEAAAQRLEDEAHNLAREIEAAEARLPRLDRVQAEREGEVRVAEQAFSEALAAHADARAARIAADAAVEAARTRLTRAQGAAERMRGRLAALPNTAELQSRKEAADRESARWADRLHKAERDAAAAEDALQAAEAARSAAKAVHGEAAAAASALNAEHRSLNEEVARGESEAAEPLIDAVTVESGYEAAFAGAFGMAARADLASASAEARWLERAGAEGGDALPPLPGGVSALACHVEGPARIAARLGMTGVIEGAPGPDRLSALAPGQSLVDREGATWRWDGLHTPANRESGAARRLRTRSRLREVEAALTDAKRYVESAEANSARTDMAAGQAQAALREARGTLSEIADRARAAKDGALDARAALERAAQQRADAEEGRASAEAALDEATRDLASAEGNRRDLPSESGFAAVEADARQAAEGARATLAEVRAEQRSASHMLADARRRVQVVTEERRDWQKRIAAVDAHSATLDARTREAEEETARLTQDAAEAQAALNALGPQQDAARAEAERRAEARAAAEDAASVHDDAVRDAQERLSTLRERRGRLTAERDAQEERRREMNRVAAETFQTAVHVLPGTLGFDEEEAEDEAPVKEALDRLAAERERLGPVNLRAETELAALREEIDASNADSEDLHAAIARLRGSIGAINREGRARMLTAFEEVDRHFRSLFTGLFGGGAARLELVESDDPLSAGLEVMAQPPGKALQSLSLLSGGEQALTAVALIFAIFLTNPAPICVLDEVDAPLDDANVERFCDLLDRMTVLTDTRFLVVTHNAVTMSRMHRLFGVTMAEQGVSQLVSVDLGGAERLAAA
ncbi:chromosome segregation protein SMC [Pacificimonas flava]|uniref:Chromosome partition protein Smc n=1 Tax=Pacificimonas flava TaxID=1234595 RepID=M2TRV2_9SPHN|nr:chromosome segregation protein SMC [Pacificimonas flava]EMD84521.1 Chromosome partition protein smc [Pacificimonas flava]MBB5279607.1 chromosome segregation protein [Pacificimonas flava]